MIKWTERERRMYPMYVSVKIYNNPHVKILTKTQIMRRIGFLVCGVGGRGPGREIRGKGKGK